MSSYFSSYRINYQLRSHKRDSFIEFIKQQLLAPFSLHGRPLRLEDIETTAPDLVAARCMQDHYAHVFSSLELLIEQHRQEQDKKRPESRLQMLVPTLGKFFTSLPLCRAFLEHDARHALSARRHVPLSFNEIRQILNTAQSMAIAKDLRLITFDGDMTLYDDGQNFDEDSELVGLLVDLLKFDHLHVAIVTAAGYSEAERYEQRLKGLLAGFAKNQLSASAVAKFWVMGGECNFLFRLRPDFKLENIPLPFRPESFFYVSMPRSLAGSQLDVYSASQQPQQLQHELYPSSYITEFLDVAERILHRCHSEMRLPAKVVRKARAVGIVATNGIKLTREQLDECVLSLQHGLTLFLRRAQNGLPPLPYCAFNGGNDVFVDIGNKLIGVRILQEYIKAEPNQVLHVGDQFLSTGNDYAARRACTTLWIASPSETITALVELQGLMRENGRTTSE